MDLKAVPNAVKAGLARLKLHLPAAEVLRRHRFILFTLLFFAVALIGIKIGASYESNRAVARATSNPGIAAPVRPSAQSTQGFNLTVPAAEFDNKLRAITSQPVTLTIGERAVPVGGDTIKSWLQISANKKKTEYHIHTSEAAIARSLTELANSYAKAPVNQVVVNEDGVERIAVRGRSGIALSDPNTLKTQASQVAKNVLDSKGLQFSTPLAEVPFASVTPAAFDKVLVANITTKKMWAYHNGQLVNSFLISAGAPDTPTPLGQFKIFAKLKVQDMRGFNADGTRYFQPQVPWVSYFYKDSAVHGVYWRPLSWFGVNNSSHGCVGLPVDHSQWVYNWAPIGTTVITHS